MQSHDDEIGKVIACAMNEQRYVFTHSAIKTPSVSFLIPEKKASQFVHESDVISTHRFKLSHLNTSAYIHKVESDSHFL